MNEQEANWWKFSIEPEKRGDKIRPDADEPQLREINRTETDGRRLIDYSDYLGLDALLAAQVPASENTEERIFISTHHLFEIAFKQMIFDLAVVSETFKTVAHTADEAEFHTVCTAANGDCEEFWRPARLAANRVKHAAKTLLPSFFHLLDKSEGKDETFSGAEYFRFRPYLPPASGFQSAQFRLIQRAFNKGELFRIRLFPAQEYSKDYAGKDSAALVEITDKVILRDQSGIANPAENSPLQKAADVDASAHAVLNRLAQFADKNADAPPMRFISEAEIETAVDAFRRILATHRKDQEKINDKPADAERSDIRSLENFRRDLEKTIAAENARRARLQLARAGAFYLHCNAPKAALTHVLQRLAQTDSALFGQHEDSFLSLHLKMAADRIRELQEFAKMTGAPEQPAGTGGGGVPYLSNVRNNLIGFFPFLVAFRDLEDAPAFSWVE